VQDAIENVVVLYDLTEAFDNGLKDHVLGGLFALVGNEFKRFPRFGVTGANPRAWAHIGHFC
jgi:hypothetical protein